MVVLPDEVLQDCAPLCGRSTSPARSQASISVQQMSAKVSRLAGSPLVAAAIASSSCARPSSTAPVDTLANPSCASARSSRSGSPAESAKSSAASA